MESTADGSFIVEDIEKEDPGTEVILHLKEEEKTYLDGMADSKHRQKIF